MSYRYYPRSESIDQLQADALSIEASLERLNQEIQILETSTLDTESYVSSTSSTSRAGSRRSGRPGSKRKQRVRVQYIPVVNLPQQDNVGDPRDRKDGTRRSLSRSVSAPDGSSRSPAFDEPSSESPRQRGGALRRRFSDVTVPAGDDLDERESHWGDGSRRSQGGCGSRASQGSDGAHNIDSRRSHRSGGSHASTKRVSFRDDPVHKPAPSPTKDPSAPRSILKKARPRKQRGGGRKPGVKTPRKSQVLRGFQPPPDIADPLPHEQLAQHVWSVYNSVCSVVKTYIDEESLAQLGDGATRVRVFVMEKLDALLNFVLDKLDDNK